MPSLTAIILDAPAWCRIGLTVRDERMRQIAAKELAELIVERMDRPPSPYDENQLPLPM